MTLPCKPRSSALAALVLLTTVSTSLACTVPVFRYALDRWQADAFSLVIPQALAEDKATNDLLRPTRANSPANLEVIISEDPAITETALFFPSGEQPIWKGDLTADSLANLMDSPARKLLREKILAGVSTVWILVDDGDAIGGTEAKRIRTRLAFLEQVASLPIQDPNDPDSQLGPGPELKLDFELIRVRRTDPAETTFIEMLRGPRPDPATAEKPFVTAAFGRGRALGTWLAEDMDNIALEDASMFLVGRCSCQVKNQNPGWDLMLQVDWDRSLAQVVSVPVDKAPAKAAAKPPKKANTSTKPKEKPNPPEEEASAKASPMPPMAEATPTPPSKLPNPKSIEVPSAPKVPDTSKESSPPKTPHQSEIPNSSSAIEEVLIRPTPLVREIPLPKASPARIALFSFAGFCALVVLIKLIVGFSRRASDKSELPQE